MIRPKVTLEVSAVEFDLIRLAMTNLYEKNQLQLSRDIPHGLATKLIGENKHLVKMIREMYGEYELYEDVQTPTPPRTPKFANNKS